jgi:hypothetical protein
MTDYLTIIKHLTNHARRIERLEYLIAEASSATLDSSDQIPKAYKQFFSEFIVIDQKNPKQQFSRKHFWSEWVFFCKNNDFFVGKEQFLYATLRSLYEVEDKKININGKLERIFIIKTKNERKKPC